MSNKVLVTGGAGYVGSHCVIELIKDGFEVVICDNWFNSKKECIKAMQKITDKPFETVSLDICDKSSLDELFNKHQFYAVIHMAGLKAVGESVGIPLEYYRNNVSGTINLLECMKKYNVKNLIFSSSCTVYGKPKYLPFDEQHPNTGEEITNPYGKTKFIVEHCLKDLYKSDSSWNIIILRYFNPIGAHESGLIGEDPRGIAHNLMPNVSQAALGRLPEMKVYGGDYDTPDGTCIRDYTHIADLASGHSLSMKKLTENPGLKVYNLGTGKGYSVLEIISAFEKASGKKVPYKIVERRAGDLPQLYSSVQLAEKELGWKAIRNLDDMCRDFWNWTLKNPKGYSI